MLVSFALFTKCFHMLLIGRYEPKFIHDIVEEISAHVLNRTYLNVAQYPG